MTASFIRVGARAPLSLTPGGALQAGGAVYASALLISSADLFAWPLPADESPEADILRFLDEQEALRGDFLLLGLGDAPVLPSAPFRAEIDRRGLGLEAMDTEAACRTYNVLIAEARRFTAALLPLANRGGSP